MKKFKTLSPEDKAKIEVEIKFMLHAHRDTLRNLPEKYGDSKKKSFNCNEGFYGEAFGIMRGLEVLGYGYFGSNNLDAIKEGSSECPSHNLKWWFDEIQNEVLEEEGFNGNNKCDYCHAVYGKDATRTNPDVSKTRPNDIKTLLKPLK